ncbi:hypothetical protein SNEBB_006451 [Seison nebaliae]|nr:hypothetical protein SNEBB_006451 [Seison nebaliae]
MKKIINKQPPQFFYEVPSITIGKGKGTFFKLTYKKNRSAVINSLSKVFRRQTTHENQSTFLYCVNLEEFLIDERNQYSLRNNFLKRKYGMNILNHCKMLRELRHDNICRIKQCLVVDTFLLIEMKFYNFGSCEEVLCQDDYQNGFQLKENYIIHRYINSRHILLNNNNAILTDFSNAICLFENGKLSYNTSDYPLLHYNSDIIYLAPEIIEQKESYDYKSDIYSLGIVAMDLAYGRDNPFKRFDNVLHLLYYKFHDIMEDIPKRPTFSKLLDFIRDATEFNIEARRELRLFYYQEIFSDFSSTNYNNERIKKSLELDKQRSFLDKIDHRDLLEMIVEHVEK